MHIALPTSRPPVAATPSSAGAAPAPPSARSLVGLAALLALFVGVPWVARPLELLLPASEVAAIGQLTETVLGVALGLWVFYLLRRQRALSRRHAGEMERLTEADALTGLGNGRALSRELGQTFNRARRSEEPVTVLYCDVDSLAAVNRRHGRPVGDLTLRMVGAVLRSSVRFGTDAGFRVGDDEFALVLAADREAALAVGRRLEGNFRERSPRQSELRVGLATWDRSATPERLIDEARRALMDQRRTARVAAMA